MNSAKLELTPSNPKIGHCDHLTSVVYRTENQFDTIRSKKRSIFDTISIRYRYSIFRYDTVR